MRGHENAGDDSGTSNEPIAAKFGMRIAHDLGYPESKSDRLFDHWTQNDKQISPRKSAFFKSDELKSKFAIF